MFEKDTEQAGGHALTVPTGRLPNTLSSSGHREENGKEDEGKNEEGEKEAGDEVRKTGLAAGREEEKEGEGAASVNVDLGFQVCDR